MLESLFTASTLLAALLIFGLRIVDVSLGTLRTISLVQGRVILAMVLGFFEVLVWITVISQVMAAVNDNNYLLIAYAGGFATGNAIGIWIDQRVAMGIEVLRLISGTKGREIAERIRSYGQAVTIFTGEGRSGPMQLLYIICKRKAARGFIAEAQKVDPEVFYVIEPATSLNRKLTANPNPTGWRAIAKKK